MNEVKTYTQEQTPILIEKLKSMVLKNMKIIDSTILGDITEEKYYNVLRGRKAAAQDSIWGMKKIEALEKQLNPDEEVVGYYKEMIPSLITKLKGMVDKNLEIVDTDIDDSLSEDKYLNVLKARKTAAEDVEWAIDEIDNLLAEVNNKNKEEIKEINYGQLMVEAKQ